MTYLMERITVDPRTCGGRPCIRGMRIRVTDILDLLASWLSAQQVLEELPDMLCVSMATPSNASTNLHYDRSAWS